MTLMDEVTRAELMRRWPHHVALSSDKVRGIKNSETVRGFANAMSVGPLTYSLLGDDGFVVFCFGKPEDAEAFAKRFSGERLPMPQR